MIVSIFSFNFEIIKDIEYYKNKTFSNKTFHFQSFLINKTFISDLKNLCFYMEIFEICQKETNQCDSPISEDVKNIIINEIKEKNNGYFRNNILKNKDKIIKLISYNNFTNLSLNEYKNNNKIILYPDNFEIVNQDAYLKIVNISQNNNIENESNLQTSLIINSGKIIIKRNEIQFLDQPNDYFLYLYSLKYEKNGNLDYIPEIVFNYDTERNRNKHFGELNKGGNIDEFYKDETTSIWDKHSKEMGKAFLLKKNENKNIEKLDNKEKK